MLSFYTRSCGGHTRMTGMRNLPVPHAALAILLPVSTCSHRTCGSCGGHTRMLGMRNLPVPHAAPEAGLAESKCSPSLCQPRAAFHTRMPGMRNLPVLHAPLEVGLAESKCSPSWCAKGNGKHGAKPHTPIEWQNYNIVSSSFSLSRCASSFSLCPAK